MPIMSYDAGGAEVDITPAAFKEQEWAKNIKSVDDMFTQFDNAQKLVGKSVQIPADDAAAEDWGKVYTKLGRPEKPEDYALNVGETADATLKEQAAGLAKIFHDNGLSKKQAAKLLEGIQGLSKAQIQQMQEAATAKDAEFNTLMEKTFGDKKDETTKVTRSLIEKFAPPALQEKMKDMSADQLAAMAAVMKGIQDTYISEDDIKALGGSHSGGAKTAEDWRAEGMRLAQLPEYKDVMHVDHEKTVKLHAAAYAKYGEMTK